MSKKIITLFLVGAFAAPISFSQAASRGEEMFKNLTCTACHGEAGRGMVRTKDRLNKKTGKYKYRKGDPMPGFEGYPKLAGQNATYLYNQMMDIFEGRRKNGMSAAMAGIKLMVDSTAKEGDLKAIAEYLSKVK